MQFQTLLGKSSIDEKQFTPLHLKNKRLFHQHQILLLEVVNSPWGRELLGIKHNFPIVKVDPNAWHYVRDVKKGKLVIQADFRTYDMVAKFLAPMLHKISIAQQSKFRIKPDQLRDAGLHFAGLRYNPRQFPTVLMAASGDFYNGGGDGFVQYTRNPPDWTLTRTDPTGTTADYTSTTSASGIDFTDHFWISRAFLPTDYSGLPDDFVIQAPCNMYVYGYQAGDYDNDGDDVNFLVLATPTSNNSLITSDYSQCGAVTNPTEGSNQVDISGFTGSGYNAYTMNSDGRGWVNATGFTSWGMREGHDAHNNQMAQSTNVATKIIFFSSERANVDQDPYSTITYEIDDRMIFMANKPALKQLSWLKTQIVRI